MTFEIFILTCNRVHLLREALNSVLRQTVAPMRITVMDNASDDGTAEYVRSVSERHHAVSLSRMPSHVSVSDNIKAAVESATADYFVMMHDDDVLSPRFAEAVLSAVEAEPSATMLSVSQRIFRGDKPSAEDAVDLVPIEIYETGADFAASDFIRFLSDQEGSLCFPAVVYRRDCVSRLGMDMSRYGKICDKPFVYSSMGAGPVVRVLAPLYHYRIHGGQDSSARANGPYPDEILNLLEAQKAMFAPDSAQSKVFRALSVLWMKSLYFWGGNPKSEWRAFHRRARSRGLVHGVFTKPWKLWIWRVLADRTAKSYAESRPPRKKLIALKGGKR